jgi:hypothetical protein
VEFVGSSTVFLVLSHNRRQGDLVSCSVSGIFTVQNVG